ncbi:MAG: phosphoribosyltransferase domain-containing protein, partial [Verrucomicrobiota bacterium]
SGFNNEYKGVNAGMAETATTLGQAVFREWQRTGGKGLYLDSTRRRTAGRVAFSFTEAHSHAPGHVIHLPGLKEDPDGIFDRAETLVIIDDEMTTGRTAANLIAAYEHHRGRSIAAHLAVLVRWSAPLEEKSPFQAHALLEGDFEFLPSPHFVPAPLASTHHHVETIAPAGTRHGLIAPQVSPWEEVPAGNVLVIGSGEFGFIPMLLAEQISANGGHGFLQCTTRSPVALGGAIGHVRQFPALSGEGYTEFLYNVPDDHSYDRVILCCEDRLPTPGHPILALPRIECRLMP